MTTLRPHPTVLIRPIEPTDRDALATAFEALAADSRMRRVLGPKHRLSERELTYLTEVDHVTHEALVALDGQRQIVAIARYTARPASSRESAELAFIVAGEWQGRGIGSALAARVVARARGNGFSTLTATTFGDNAPSRMVLSGLGFQPVGSADGMLSYELELRVPEPRRDPATRPARRLMRLGEMAVEVAIRRPWRPAY
jgi:RimJ/RimL family protein N-acetyltransferase